MKRLFGAALAACVLMLYAGVAFAQGETVINVGELLAPWLQYLVAALVAVVLAILGWLAALFQRKTGIEIDLSRMATLQSGIENMAGRVVMLLGDKLNGVTLDVRHPVIKQAIEGLFKAAPDAIAHFGLTPDQLGQKIIDKIGVITASNAAVAPTAQPATTPGV